LLYFKNFSHFYIIIGKRTQNFNVTCRWQLTAQMLPTKLLWRDWVYVSIVWRWAKVFNSALLEIAFGK
jgi:hypothetical protein